jgi:hypothetical protein
MNPMAGKIDSPNLQAAPATLKNQLPGLGYDPAGNVTSNGSATYTYDAEGHLTDAEGATYTYDGDGNRNSGGLLPRLARCAVIYGVISKMTPQPCCTVLQPRLPPRNVVPYKLPLASTMMFP